MTEMREDVVDRQERVGRGKLIKSRHGIISKMLVMIVKMTMTPAITGSGKYLKTVFVTLPQSLKTGIKITRVLTIKSASSRRKIRTANAFRNGRRVIFAVLSTGEK